MTAVDRPDNGHDEGWGDFCPRGPHLPCESAVCACRCHVSLNDQLASGRAGAGEQQREQVEAVIESQLWQREKFTLDIPDEPGHRLAWAAGAGPFIRGLADELLALLGGPQPDGEAVAAARACWCAHCEGIVLAADHPTNWVARIGGRRFIVCRDCGDKRCPRAAHHDRPCAYREPCPVYSHGTDGWHCAVTGDHDQHTNAAGTETW